MNIHIGITYVCHRKSRFSNRISSYTQAIHGYRESERSEWTPENQKVLSRIRQLAFDDPQQTLMHVHILDIAKDGYIKPHIDAVRVCQSIKTK